MARLDWASDGRDWPLREHSRFVDAAGIRWHVQQLGRGPVWLLLHGTGAATHSWRDVAPRLARDATVVAVDLPGHGFTSAPPGFGMFSAAYTLPGMAAALGELLRVLGVRPHGVVGHSAGAAIAARMVLDGLLEPQVVASLNGALLPLPGLAAWLFPPMARLMAATPVAAHLFAWRAADRRAVQRLIDGTGSRLDERGVELYARLVANAHHCHAALAMMAQWDVAPLWRDLPRLGGRLHLGVGRRDRAVPPSQAQRVHRHVPGSTLTEWPALGHLSHEEEPALTVRWLHTLDGAPPHGARGAHAAARVEGAHRRVATSPHGDDHR
ncbi:alpha/beta fold hydrolase BchO [Azohydromonas sediminis]|uniref:alpha/beta fold hydrolase BchO n=1 Tax=Azohydromonas sediminis TaxID=2259674 RepID=UPI000E65A0D9|nr:alpha/beta fold hydrolase BchO [Azohydromonas sediminis]